MYNSANKNEEGGEV